MQCFVVGLYLSLLLYQSQQHLRVLIVNLAQSDFAGMFQENWDAIFSFICQKEIARKKSCLGVIPGWGVSSV